MSTISASSSEPRRSARVGTKRTFPDYVDGRQATSQRKAKKLHTTNANTKTAGITKHLSRASATSGGGAVTKPKKTTRVKNTTPPKKSKKQAVSKVIEKGKDQEKEEEEEKSTDGKNSPDSASAGAVIEKAAKDNNHNNNKNNAIKELKEGDLLPADLPQVQTHTGETTTLSSLVAAAEKGIVIFAYPKASTPGCTVQACAFRDNHSTFKTAGFAVYGLSGDTPSANDKFSTKQSLGDITLLCDPKYELHSRLGIQKGTAKGTIRSVIVITKKDNDSGIIAHKGPASPAQSVPIAQKVIENAQSTT